MATLFSGLALAGVPLIHFGVNTAHLLEAQRAAGGTVLGVDWRLDLDVAWQRIGHDCAVQGNLDPLLLCAPRQAAVDGALGVLKRAGGRPGHVFNVGHGLVPDTPVDNVKAVIDAVHEGHASG
jgi:uroporphyrinogen decarboxylase